MSSWFSNIVDSQSLKELSQKVQSSIPKIDKEMLEKLTLTTPELTEERKRIDEEERRKEAVHDMLAGMLPWETRDSERDILVEECKEAILKLSSNKETFFGPYQVPKAAVKSTPNETSKEDEHEAIEEEETQDLKPSNESLEKLEKLQPLPPLLEDFDLDAHVGLIEKLLKVDPTLVKMQSSLSGGGAREKVFWHNYFFHCAYTRYEAGLSVDEIWSDQPRYQNDDKGAAGVNNVGEEETVTFTDDVEDEHRPSERAFIADPVEEADQDEKHELDRDSVTGASASAGADFEMVGEGDQDNGSNNDIADYELDELEAEIARELED